MKKGRHRRYEEARKFQRDAASDFSVEDFDFDAPEPWASDDDDEGSDGDDQYAELAAKYADDEDEYPED